MSKLIVVARYNENLDWTAHLKSPLIVYNKGDEWPYSFPRKDIPNKGREPETYLRAIIENYSILEKYKYLVFLQGNPFDHCDDLFSKIDNFNDEDFGYLCDTTGVVQIEKTLYFDNFSYALIESLINENYNEQSGAIKSLILLNFFGIKLPSCLWYYSCGAQYIVPVNSLLEKPVEWWMHIYRVYDSYLKLTKDDPGLIFEFIWPMLWNHKMIEKE